MRPDSLSRSGKRPSVLHLAHFDPPIHGEAMMAERLKKLAIEWDDIDYFSINAVYSEDRDQLGRYSLKKIARLLTYLGKMVSACFRKRADTIVLHPAFHPAPFIKESIFVWIARLLRMKVIAWVHMDPNRLDLENRSPLFQKWVHLTLSRIDLVVACAPSLSKSWPDWLTQRPHTAIANVIECPLDITEDILDKSGRENPLRVVFLSAIDSEKGWRELHEAAIKICDVRGDAEFLFYGGIGSGEDEEEVSRVFRSTRHSSQIKYLGPVWGDEKFKCLMAGDLFVFPSHTEQFPLTILEAMSCSLPVISTKVGAVSDALVTPQGGRFVDIASSDSLVTAIEELLSAPDQLRLMGEFNRKRFHSELSVENFERNWREILNRFSGESLESHKITATAENAMPEKVLAKQNECPKEKNHPNQ